MGKRMEKMAFGFGVVNLLGAIAMVEDIGAFLFFLVISFVCFVNCRKLLLKIFCGSVIKRKIRLTKTKLYLKKEVDLLVRKKKSLELFISDNDKYVNEIIDYGENAERLKKEISNLKMEKNVLSENINDLEIEKEKIITNNNQVLSFKEKKLKKKIRVLESQKENLEDFMKQEEIISRAINDKTELFDILSNKNENLKEQNENLKSEIALLERQVRPMKQKVSFVNTISLEYVDGLDGYGFEEFTSELLRCLGFDRCTTTQSSGDYGIDVVAEKDGVKYGIQCKNYTQAVGNKAIQEAYSGKDYYGCHVAIVFTNNYFTASAVNQAEKNGVVLWDRDKLREFIETLT